MTTTCGPRRSSPGSWKQQSTRAREWAYAGDVNVDDALRVLSGAPPPAPDEVVALLPRWNPVASGGSNVIVRSRVLAAVGGFDPTLHRTEDWDLWIRIARTGPPAWVCEPLVAYRFHAGNVVGTPGEMVDEARRLATRHAIPVDVAAMHRRAAWAALRGGRRLVALRHYAHAFARGDLRSVGRAAFALFHPKVGGDGLFGLLRRDAAWIAQAEPWLSAFARGPIRPTGAVVDRVGPPGRDRSARRRLCEPRRCGRSRRRADTGSSWCITAWATPFLGSAN